MLGSGCRSAIQLLRSCSLFGYRARFDSLSKAFRLDEPPLSRRLRAAGYLTTIKSGPTNRVRSLRKALSNPRAPRSAPARVSPVLETLTMVLKQAGEPMRAREIDVAACELVGEPLLRTSVKAAPAAGTK